MVSVIIKLYISQKIWRGDLMSFARFSDSDVYIFEHVGGFIQCCGCSLKYDLSLLCPTEERIAAYLAKSDSEDYAGLDFINLATPREALAHLEEHIKLGHDVVEAKERILEEYTDLDIKIQPYVRDLESEARIKQKVREAWDSEATSE
jgi:hypothetical protein